MRSLASDIAIVLLLLFVALGFRAPCMNGSLWLDELHTGWTISQSVSDIAPRARMGNNLPLYFYLVNAVTTMVGTNEFALRLPSLIAGLGAIATSYFLIRRWTGSIAAGVATAGAMMIDPHFLFYSVEARPYALIQWIGLIQVAAFLAWLNVGIDNEGERLPRFAGLIWVVASTLLFYLHCTSILLPLIQLPLAISLADSKLRWRYGLAWAAFLLLTLLAAPTLLEIYSRRDAWNAFIGMPRFSRLLWLFPIAWSLVPAAACWLADRQIGAKLEPDVVTHDKRVAFSSRRLLLIGLMFALPLLLAFTLTRTDIVRLFLRRYLIVVSGLPLLLSGLFIGHIRSQGLRYLAALATLAATIYAGPYTQLAADGRIVQRSRENWRATVALLNEQAQPGDVILIASDLIEADRLHDPIEAANADFVSYCALPLTGFYELRNDVTVIPIPINEPNRYVVALNEKPVASPRWIVSRRFDSERLDSLVPAGGTRIDHRDRSPMIVEIKP